VRAVSKLPQTLETEMVRLYSKPPVVVGGLLRRESRWEGCAERGSAGDRYNIVLDGSRVQGGQRFRAGGGESTDEEVQMRVLEPLEEESADTP